MAGDEERINLGGIRAERPVATGFETIATRGEEEKRVWGLRSKENGE